MEYLVRLAQVHESFRRPELQALAKLQNIDIQFLDYADDVSAIRRGSAVL